MLTAPATTCPAYCTRVHDERPDEVVVHESTPVRVAQLPEPRGAGKPILLQISQDDEDAGLRLHLSEFTFDLDGAEQVLAELTVLVTTMRETRFRQIVAAESVR